MVTQANATQFSTPNDNEIVMTRTFDAPAALIWEASTRPEHIERWWGPRAYTVEVKHMDVRVGGTYRFVHRNAEGQAFVFSGTYLELQPSTRMVMTQVFEGIEGQPAAEAPGDQMQVTNTLEEHDGKTTMTSVCRLKSKEARDQVLGYGMTDGAAESHDRLAELLRSLQA